jgi:HEPN domain-containing protein
VNRTNFRRLAEIRIVEARVLIDNRKYDGGYYLAGYAVECGLKACIAKLTKVYDFPPKSVNEYYTHDLEKLVKTAGLTIERNTDAATDPDLAANWQVVKDWSEQSRYQQWTKAQATSLYDAVTDNSHGVLPWIKLRW